MPGSALPPGRAVVPEGRCRWVSDTTRGLVAHEVSKSTNFRGHWMNKICYFKLLDGRNGEMDILFILMRQYFIQSVLSKFTCKPSLAQKHCWMSCKKLILLSNQSRGMCLSEFSRLYLLSKENLVGGQEIEKQTYRQFVSAKGMSVLALTIVMYMEQSFLWITCRLRKQ